MEGMVCTMDSLLLKYVGAVCEVKTMENDLLLHGRIRTVFDGEEGESALELISMNGSEMPMVQYGMLVKLHAFSNEYGLLPLGGRVYIAGSSFWRITGITQYGNAERRQYFRVRVRGEGFVSLRPDPAVPGKDTPPVYPMRVLSASLSGVLIEANAFFRLKDILQLTDIRLDEDFAPLSARCSVQRIDLNRPRGVLYGCRFEDLDDKATDRLYSTIFELQRREIRRRKRRL